MTREEPPSIDLLIVGHVTRDVLPDGDWRAGGAALYAGVTALRHGLRVGIVTSAPADLAAHVRSLLAGAQMVVVDAETATTFENVYTAAGRVQFLRSCASPLRLDDIPEAWRRCDLALLAPVACEFEPALVEGLSNRLIGAAPQGWLRAWDDDGRVRPRALLADETSLLGHLTALILSREDLTGPEASADALLAAERTLAGWARTTLMLAITRGPGGAEIWRAGRIDAATGYPAHEIDPTGAGDVFATAFLCALAASGDPAAAADHANRVAAMSVEGVGPSAIPTPEQVAARFGPSR